MDYLIRRRTEDLDSTGYIEVGPGRYTCKHWQPGFLFVWEDAFAMAEGIVTRHLPEYDHFGVNEVPRSVGVEIIRDWRAAARDLGQLRQDDAALLLNLGAAFRSGLAEQLEHQGELADLLRELADECERFYTQDQWVCILGI